MNYSSENHSRLALKMDAGVQGNAASAAAHCTGYRVVSGNCPTIGIAGGFSLNGSHSFLLPMHSLGVDNILD